MNVSVSLDACNVVYHSTNTRVRALLALAVASGFAQRDAGSRAIHGMVGAMMVYNAGAASILAHGGVALGLSGFGLWPTVALHAALAVRCIACLSKASASRPGPQPETL